VHPKEKMHKRLLKIKKDDIMEGEIGWFLI